MATWSGLWDGFYKQPYAPLSGGNTKDYNRTAWNDLAKLSRRGPNGRKMGAIIRALTGSAVGADTALVTTPVIPSNAAPGSSYSGGGYVAATTRTEINRVTNAADLAWVDGATTLRTQPTTYPVDKGGGGAKRPGFF